MARRSLVLLTCAAALAGVVAACSKSPAQRFAAGNKYMSRTQYREAIIEYRNALRANPAFGEARVQLAEAYLAVGDTQNAYREYVRAADLLPQRDDVQVKAGSFLLVAGRFEDARARAERVLDRYPSNVDAQVLLG